MVENEAEGQYFLCTGRLTKVRSCTCKAEFFGFNFLSNFPKIYLLFIKVLIPRAILLKKKSLVKLNKFYEENNAFCNAFEKTFYTNEKRNLTFPWHLGQFRPKVYFGMALRLLVI